MNKNILTIIITGIFLFRAGDSSAQNKPEKNQKCEVFLMNYFSFPKVRLAAESLVYDSNDTSFVLNEKKTELLIRAIRKEASFLADSVRPSLNRSTIDCRMVVRCFVNGKEQLMSFGANNRMAIGNKVYSYTEENLKHIVAGLPLINNYLHLSDNGSGCCFFK